MNAAGPHGLDRAITQQSMRSGQPLEIHALFFSIFHLTLAAWHIGLITAIQTGHRFCLLADGGAHTIHRGVPAANHHHIFVLSVQHTAVKGGHIITKRFPVAGGQEIKSRHNPVKANPGHFDIPGFIHACRNQNRVMLCPQIGKADIAANLTI